MRAMADPTAAARRYLEASLPFGQWTAVSHALGRNHAYIEQYIRRGKPKYLGEADRERLVELYGLDGERLKPPKRSARSAPFVRSREKRAGDLGWINPRCDNLVEQASKAEINHLLDQLSATQQAFVLRMILAAVALAGKSTPRSKNTGPVAA